LGDWQSIGLFSGVDWPAIERNVRHRDLEAFFLPETDIFLPTLAAECPPSLDLDEALTRLRGLLSALSWMRRSSYPEFAVIGFGRKVPIGKALQDRSRGWNACAHFSLDRLPEPHHSDAQLGLALYRESLNANSVLYRFLCLYKVINILEGNEAKQVSWINGKIASISDADALTRLGRLKAEGRNVGKYLYQDGRCAVAHARARPLVNPEDPRDLRRLQADLPVMRSLAEYAIENEIAGGLSREPVRPGIA
jgi:hypothetical protein